MSVEPLWIVIESISLINHIPIITYEQPTNFFESEISRWYKPYNLIQQNNHPRTILHESLANIKLVGIYSNFESAQLAVRFAPNRKILGPAVVK
jgi:hypothetical protein